MLTAIQPAVEKGPSTMSEDAGQTEAPARKPRVLMLTHRLPYPPDRGDRIRAYHMLKFLAKHFDVAIACVSEEAVWLQHHQLLAAIAKKVDILPISPTIGKLRGLFALLTGKAVTPACHFRPALAQTIEDWHDQWPFDAVLTFCTGMIDYARYAVHAHGKNPRPIRHVLDLVDVDSQKWARYAKDSWPPMSWVYSAEARRLRKIEAGKHDKFDAITVISDAEADAYREHVGQHDKLRVVENGVDTEYFEPQDDVDDHTMVFVGVLNYRPNVDGIVWFVKQVMPKLRERLPDAKLEIVGRHPVAKVQELEATAGVHLVGSVPDVREHIASASVSIAPLLLARGVQNKVLEAMSSSRAVVCSPAAAEGIDAAPGSDLIVTDGDDPDSWVDHLERALTDTEYRKSIATAARKRVEDRYSWDACLQPLLGLLTGDNE